MSSLIRILLAAALLAGAWSAWAGQAQARRACIYDPVGADGVVYDIFQNYVIQAQQWGYDLKAIAYTDEAVAANDFRAGKCDLVVLSGVRTREFVRFAGSLDMAGGVQTYAQQKTAITAISGAKANELMRQDGYEVVGVVPLGKVFLFSRKRDYLASLDALAGRRIAILGYDRQSREIAAAVGASPVPASIASLGPLFNNGSVELTYAPALAYEPLELETGLAASGGIADFVLGMLSGQVLIHRDRFDEGFGPRSREWTNAHLVDRTIEMAKKAEARIPEKFWVRINAERENQYRERFRNVRETLWDADWYSHRMQRLLKKIRCSSDAGLAECTLDVEGGTVP